MKLRIDYLGGKRFKVYCRQHSFSIDLPAAKGGSDSAPDPVEYFISGLGACMGVYGLMYCNNAGIQCENMRITVNAERSEDSTRLAKIDYTVSNLSSSLGPRKEAFIKAMEHCFVHQTIASNPKISVNIEEPEPPKPEETDADDADEASEEKSPEAVQQDKAEAVEDKSQEKKAEPGLPEEAEGGADEKADES